MLAISSINYELINTIAFALLGLGLVFGLIELCLPGFGIFGGIGVISCVAGVVLRLIAGESLLVTLAIIVVICVFYAVLFLILGKSAKNGRLSKSSIVLSETAVSENRPQGTIDYSSIVGKVGITTTDLRPVGKGMFEGETVEIVSADQIMISSGTDIVCVNVEGARVLVQKTIA